MRADPWAGRPAPRKFLVSSSLLALRLGISFLGAQWNRPWQGPN